MLKEIHEHILSELQQSSRTDTVFVISAVLFNLIVLGINSGVASPNAKGQVHPPHQDVILSLLIVATILINFVVARALLTGRDTRKKLLNGIVTMYQDNKVDKYYDQSLLNAYSTRYKLFTAVIGILALIAIIVPLITRIFS
jgi:hypothetical protein